MSSFEAAESFTLSAGETIRGIEFADEDFAPSFSGTLNYYIYSNSGFFPGTLLAQGSNPALSRSFVMNGGTQGVSIVRDDFNLITPLSLNPGTYWVGLNFSGGSFSVWDETTTPNAQLSAGTPVGTMNFNLDAVQLYLGISDTPLAPVAAPEPGSILLAGLGLAAALVWHRGRVRT